MIDQGSGKSSEYCRCLFRFFKIARRKCRGKAVLEFKDRQEGNTVKVDEEGEAEKKVGDRI